VIGFVYTVLSVSTAKADEQVTVQVAPASDAVLSQIETATVISVSAKIELATTTLQTAVDGATATVAAIPNAQVLVSESVEATKAVIKAGEDIKAAQDAISTTVVAIAVAESATTTAALEQAQTQVAVAAVESATATVAVVTQTVTNAQTALTTAQEAQPALDAAAACAPGTSCVDFYNKNAELGPLHDQIAPAQAAADAAVAAVPTAQTAVDVATTTVATKETTLTTALETATQAQAAADSSSVTTTTNGVKATVYSGTGRTPAIPTENTTPILTTTVPQIAFNWGNGSVMDGPGDRVIVKFEGTITVPEEASAAAWA